MEIKQYQSPNKMSRNGWKPDLIVFHISEGYFESGIGWLCNPKSQASAHFFVSKQGEIAQMVDIREAAFVNGTSIKEADNRHYSHASSYFVRDRRTNANYYTIGIEHEGFYKDTHGELTDEQLKATIWLTGYIKEQIRQIYGTDIKLDREHILGHCEVNPITKPHCPGEDFPFNEIVDFYNKKEEIEVEKEIVPQWKINGEKYLREMGYLSSEHDPLETLDMGTLGIILQNFNKQAAISAKTIINK